MKRLLFHLCICLIAGGMFSCDRRDLNELYRTAAENELMVKHLEATVDGMNEEIRNLRNLADALMARLYVTQPVEKIDKGYLFVFGNASKADSIRVVIPGGRTPLIEISPNTENWMINGVDTGVSAVGKDGLPALNPLVRISADNYWEYSADGKNWEKTSVKAAGKDAEDGIKPEMGINEDGYWTINGQVTAPPLRAYGENGVSAKVPMIGIDKSVAPYRWKISTDGGITWTTTEFVAQATDGKPGNDGVTSPYIQQVAVKNDTIIFTFNANIPGTVPPTRIKKVVLNPKAKLAIEVLPNGNTMFNNRLYVFGTEETKVLKLKITGTDIISVAPIHVADFLTVKVNRVNNTLTLTSCSKSKPFSSVDNFFRVQVVNARGEFASALVIAEPVQRIVVKNDDFNLSYIVNVCGSQGASVMEKQMLVDGDNVAEDYYYCWRTSCTYNQLLPYYNGNAYPTTVKPLLLTDIDGNSYKLCRSPSYVWMVGNLKTTRYNDGTPIQNISNTAVWAADTCGACCYYGNDKGGSMTNQYGLLYNGYAVKKGNLCPKGWHVATDKEWLEIEKLMEKQWGNGWDGPEWVMEGKTGWRGSKAGYSLRWKDGWGNDNKPGNLHQYVLEARPGGYRDGAGTFTGVSTSGYWWSPTENLLYNRGLDKNKNGAVYRGFGNLRAGMSVRCVKDK